MLRFLRRPNDELDVLLGDAITEDLPRIVAGVFDGDAEALFAVIADPNVDEYARDALLGAATFLTWQGSIPRERMQRFLRQFRGERSAPDLDLDLAWVGWLNAIALLGEREIVPLVRAAWDEGRIPKDTLDLEDFESDLLAAERRPDDTRRFASGRLGFMEDTIEAMQWTDTEGRDEPSSAVNQSLPSPNTPVMKPWRHVGRNDPCPCGSGRKAKTCCLAG